MLARIADHLRGALGILAKKDVQIPARHLAREGGAIRASGANDATGTGGATGYTRPALGDDCAAIPDGDGYLLLAAEGIWPTFLEGDPRFAGYSAVMVNVSDVYAMGGRPIAVVDVVWGTSAGALEPVWEGMLAASRAYRVPIVGGHTSARSPYNALAVAIAGRARRLITSFAARPGDVLVAAIDLRGRMHPEHPFWDASTGADPARLRADLEILPALAEAGLCDAGKDISMGGVAGTLLMLLETSGVGAVLDVEAVPRPRDVRSLRDARDPRDVPRDPRDVPRDPRDVPLERWLLAFPSYGFLLSVRPEAAREVLAAFERRGIASAAVGVVDGSRRLTLEASGERQVLWDLAAEPLTGLAGEGAR
ncbi:sll0787 family AIR synthase-like protein [Sorangium sp. So ce131]|uniref:sll0787 family AIR synthase-like protein n=1 Tax=Sorangium sp. So ce131 TaxID=3133282 RepID=UPI003F62A54C